MARRKLNLGIIVEKSSDFERPTVKIASKDKVFEIDADQIPPEISLGEWVVDQCNNFETVMKSVRCPSSTKVVDGERVQVFSYVTPPFGHCSYRDGFIPPNMAHVWSPHLGWAFCKDRHGLREEILYQAWFEYRIDCRANEPIWELKETVGEPLIDPAKTILLARTPWKQFTMRTEVKDPSQKDMLNAERRIVDEYHVGLVIALICKQEPSVVVYSRSYGGIVTVDSKIILPGVYRHVHIGEMVKFYERTYHNTNEAKITEVIFTTIKDIRFETKERHSSHLITILTSIGIDDDLLTDAGSEHINCVCEYGAVSVRRENFALQMSKVKLNVKDLLKAKNEEKELQVWIRFNPLNSKWRLSRIHLDWFTDKTS